MTKLNLLESNNSNLWDSFIEIYVLKRIKITKSVQIQFFTFLIFWRVFQNLGKIKSQFSLSTSLRRMPFPRFEILSAPFSVRRKYVNFYFSVTTCIRRAAGYCCIKYQVRIYLFTFKTFQRYFFSKKTVWTFEMTWEKWSGQLPFIMII